MSSYEKGVWTHANNCPTCWAVRLSQGFVLYGGTGEQCDACYTNAELVAFYASAEYVAWQSTLPEGLAMEELSAWMVENPAPVFVAKERVKKTENTTFPPTILDG